MGYHIKCVFTWTAIIYPSNILKYIQNVIFWGFQMYMLENGLLH